MPAAAWAKLASRLAAMRHDAGKQEVTEWMGRLLVFLIVLVLGSLVLRRRFV
jgi:hypothetical protein